MKGKVNNLNIVVDVRSKGNKIRMNPIDEGVGYDGCGCHSHGG